MRCWENSQTLRDTALRGESRDVLCGLGGEEVASRLSLAHRASNATSGLNSGLGTRQGIVGPHLTVLVPLPTHPTLFSLPQPFQHAWLLEGSSLVAVWESVALVVV